MTEVGPLHDYSRSRAVVMGTWDYDFLPPVPAARNSLQRMTRLLTGPHCDWPVGRLLTLANRRDPGNLPDQLITAFDDVSDVALFYYVGHGQIDADDQLCLGLVASTTVSNRRATTSLPFQAVRRALLDSRAATKIVILDCCFADLANRPANTLTAQVDDMLDRTAGTGAYTIAATRAYATAWYETDRVNPQTYFTKYLADIVETTGIPGQPPGLRLHALFTRLHDKLGSDGLPVPHARSVDNARDFVFARNAAPPRKHRDPEQELQQIRQQMAKAEERLAVAEEQRMEAEARERQLRQRLREDQLRGVPPIDAEQKQQLRNDLRQAEREIDEATTAQAEAEAALHDVAAKVLEYSTDKGPAELAANPPPFADQTYRQLARAAVLAENPQAVLRLIDISRENHHIEGEACWLAFAHRLHIPGTALALGQVHGGAGLDEHMRVFTITAFLEGDDNAGREILRYPSEVLEGMLVETFSGMTLKDVFETAAKAGSFFAQYELGAMAVETGEYERSVQFLKGPAVAGNANASYLLGVSLLALRRPREARRWLRKSGADGHYYAKLALARTSGRRRPIRVLARQTVIELDADRIEGDATDQAELMMKLADCCLERSATAEAIVCLRRAATRGNNAAMIRLGQLYTDSGKLQVASKWLEQALPDWVPDKDLEALLFRLACRLSWEGDHQGSRRWLTVLADMGNAQAAEIVAEVRDLPAKPRWRPPSPRPMLHASWRMLVVISIVLAHVVSIVGRIFVSAVTGWLVLLFAFVLFVNSIARSEIGYRTFSGEVYIVASLGFGALGSIFLAISKKRKR